MGLDNFEKNNRTIQEIFSRIADNYDRMNQTISFGRAMSWRLDAIQKLNICHSDRILDIATGSGDLALLIKEKYKDTFIIGIDITPQMIQIARKRMCKKRSIG